MGVPDDVAWSRRTEPSDTAAAGTGAHLAVAIPRTLPGAALAAATLLLTLAGLAFQVLRHEFGRDWVFGLAPFFNLDSDASIPTWYAAATLALSALLLGTHAWLSRRAADRNALAWAALAVVFVLMSVDEVARIHERLGDALGTRLVGEAGGVLHYRWVVPGAAFVLLVGALSLRFLTRLPARVRWGLVAAGAVFVAGGLGVEMLNASSAARGAEAARGYGSVVEEFLEMAGIALFVHVLFTHLAARLASLTVRVAASRPG